MTDREARLAQGSNAWHQTLGIEYDSVTPERVSGRLLAGPQHHQPYGIVHGGVYCSIVEDAASHGAGQLALSRGLPGVVGVSNQTDFLRSHGEGELEVEAFPLHAGRSQQLWEVRITRARDSLLVARGQVRFQNLDRLPDPKR
jgi:uncharacterized protein (TIGR00369 family)